MRINRTYRVRETALKAYYYMRATLKIESNENESYVFEQIILEGMRKLEELSSQGKTIIMAHYNGKRYTIGGNMDKQTIEKVVQLCSTNKWQVQECIEIMIYLSATQRFTEEEMNFFGMQNWKIAIM